MTPETKPWYLSKTLWSAILAIALTVYNALAPVQHWPEIPEQVYALLAAFGLYGLRTANTTIGKLSDVPPKAEANILPADHGTAFTDPTQYPGFTPDDHGGQP